MKTTKHFLTVSMLFVMCMAQAQNPWEKYGYTPPKPLTLSDGKYEEFFTNDTIVQIGSVMFNTVTNQVVAFLETEIVYSEATLKPEVISRFLSPDPLEKQFPMLTPYQYASNTPIQAIDLDGLEALVVVGRISYGDKQILQIAADADVKNNATVPFQFTFGKVTYKADELGNPNFGFKEIQSQMKGFKQVQNQLYVGDKPISGAHATADNQNFGHFTHGVVVPNDLSPNEFKNVDVPVTTSFSGISGNFGNLGNAATFNFTAPQSSTNVNVNLNFTDFGQELNSFSFMDASGNVLGTGAPGQSGSASFTIPSGSNFSIQVTGKAGASTDVFNVQGSFTTTEQKKAVQE